MEFGVKQASKSISSGNTIRVCFYASFVALFYSECVMVVSQYYFVSRFFGCETE